MNRRKKRRNQIISVLLVVVIIMSAVFIYHKKTQKETPEYNFNGATFIGTEDVQSNQQPKEERSYSVSSSNDIATAVGMSVLEYGGNAVDAAIAIGYVLGVVEPYGSGLGGSGGMLVYDMNTEDCVYYDYRASAGTTTNSYDNVGVPGFVAGMEAVHQDYGTIQFSDLIQPAIDYADNGFKVDESLEYRLSVARPDLENLSMLYTEEGDYLSVGDTLIQKDLANTLRAIQNQGASIFYNGYIAEDIAANSSLSVEDFASYKVLKGEVVSGTYEGYKVYSSGAPLSGTTLIQMLKMSEMTDFADPSKDLQSYVSQLEQITDAAYTSRYRKTADPTFYDIDEQYLTSDVYIQELLQMETTMEYEEEESHDTTSFCVVDSNGLVVSATNSLSQFFGRRILVDGIFLNNTNSNFTNGINEYEPGKRSRTFSIPTIIVGEDGYVMAVGTPGGNNIPCILFNVLVDILKYDMDPQEAINKMHVIYRGNILYVELDENGETWFDTSAISQSVVPRNTGYWWGSISLAGYSRDTGAFAAYDYRRGATMAGVSKQE